LPKNQDGEYELILGNHQLLGVFFMVIVLLGVFFAMGYLVGRNSTPTVTADATPHKADSKPLVVDSPGPPAREASPDPDPAPRQPVSTQPQTPSEPTRADIPTHTTTPKPTATSGGQPTPGTYLQLSATTQKAEADLMVDILRKKKFPALVAEIPELPGTFRVLVGPLADADVNQTRADLQAASLPGKEAIKKKF
jgi:cell division septation protein DedD